MKITVAHSPDADDAFMFYALARGKINTEGLEFVHTLQDIQKCNEDALGRKFDVTAISFAAYPEIAWRYCLLTAGASMGEKDYGPLLVAREPLPLQEIPKRKIAVPGAKTTAVLVLKKIFPGADNLVVFPFDQIMEAVLNGRADVGLLIHEGQLTHQAQGLVSLLNFGTWWWERENLPLPLGGNVVARDLDAPLQGKINRLLRQSIEYALARREEALDHALQFSRGLSKGVASEFVGMYVNERTLDYGAEGKEALVRLLGFQPEFVA